MFCEKCCVAMQLIRNALVTKKYIPNNKQI